MTKILSMAGGAAMRQLRWCLSLLLPLAATGCMLGPRTLENTHGPYNEAIKDVEIEQLLLNIVRLRYNDNPMRLDVTNVVAQKEVDTNEGGQPFLTSSSSNGIFRFFPFVLPFFNVRTADRPTISYRPLDDPENIRRLFEPAEMPSIISLAETGWPVSTVLPVFVDYLNHLPNAIGANGPPRGVISDFSQFRAAVGLLQMLHDAGAVHFVSEEKSQEMGSPLPPVAITSQALIEAAKNGFTYRQQTDKSWVLVKRQVQLTLKIDPNAVASPEVLELCRLLNLQPGLTSYGVTALTSKAFAPEPFTALNVLPRSAIAALYYLSTGVQVPEAHLKKGIVTPLESSEPPTEGLFTVLSACAKKHHGPPCNAWVVVKYHGYWFYIDDRDIDSRRTLTFMLLMTRAGLAKATKEGPVLTLPLGR